MPEAPQRENDHASRFANRVGDMAARKRDSQSRSIQSVWRGLGMFGLVGWSITLPTLFGVMIGISLDSRYPGVHSWTLTMLFVGLAVGCLNAWHWISLEQKAIHDQETRK